MSLFANIHDAIAEFRSGRPVILVDDEDRENEGDLSIPAEFATPEIINFMASEAHGLICMPTTGERLDQLGLPLIYPRTAKDAAAFTIPVDARDGVSTGISAEDRARTVATILDPRSHPQDLVSPGHLFPLRYAEDGVLARPGHTEASVDLARLAGCYPAAVICEVLSDNGNMARGAALLAFAQRHGVAVATIADLIDHRRSEAPTPSRFTGDLTSAVTGRGLYLLSDLLQ